MKLSKHLSRWKDYSKKNKQIIESYNKSNEILILNCHECKELMPNKGDCVE